MRKTVLSLTIVVFVLLSMSALQAATLAGVTLPDTTQVGSSKLPKGASARRASPLLRGSFTTPVALCFAPAPAEEQASAGIEVAGARS